MIRLYLLRHGITEWNVQRRIQGSTDIPLNETGLQQISQWQLKPELIDIPWYSSPLQRATKTADILQLNYSSHIALKEMNWGDWEGQVMKKLRKQPGSGVHEQELRGWDMQPPNGESPRHVYKRVKQWIRNTLIDSSEIGIICHMGIIRCLYGAAENWDMICDSEAELSRNSMHIFDYDLNTEECFFKGSESLIRTL